MINVVIPLTGNIKAKKIQGLLGVEKKKGLKIIAWWMEGFVWDDAKFLETDGED